MHYCILYIKPKGLISKKKKKNQSTCFQIYHTPCPTYFVGYIFALLKSLILAYFLFLSLHLLWLFINDLGTPSFLIYKLITFHL